MSAPPGTATATVSRDLQLLAPRFRDAVSAAIADCRRDGLDAVVFEGYRSNELQSLYYQRGRTVKPPERPVTNAPTNLYSWHGFGLAVDVISESARWDKSPAWFAEVAERFKAHGCKWGGDWRSKDYPHMQFGRCRASPSDRARELLASGGLDAVWREVGAA